MEKNRSKRKMMMRARGCSLVSEDVIQNILSRLDALSFSSAACVNKSWNKVCGRILSRPKLASALSLNPSLHDAVKEVLDKVLSEPISPHFAIACIGKQFDIEVTHQLITEKLGSRVPVITNASSGIIGLDVVTNKLKEVRWESSNNDDGPGFQGDGLIDRGIVLVVGFLPGLKVDAIPLLRPKVVPQIALVERFVTDIRNFTASVSDSMSPAGIILFGDKNIDMKPVLANMDYALHDETVIVGDASGCFLCRSADNSQNNHADMYLDAVALVFARDKHKSHDIGETQFHVTLSTGVIPFGPNLQAVCVVTKDSECSWLTARMEGQNEILDGEGLLIDINDQLDDDEPRDLYIGVVHQRGHSTGSESSTSRGSLVFYEVIGGDKEFFVVNGVGIRPGDYFLFYHSDSDTASSSCGNAYKNLETLKEESRSKNCQRMRNVAGINEEIEVFGGLIFSCYLRAESFQPYFDSFPFSGNFPGVPLAGAFCSGEIGRGSSSSISQEDDEENSARCCLHHRSAVYLVMSYVPATSEH